MQPLTFTESHCRLASDVRYGVMFNAANERFYARVDFALNLAQIVGGASAVVALTQRSDWLSATAGVVLAVCSAFALLIQPGAKAERHRAARNSFNKLEGRVWDMAERDLARELATLQAESPVGIQSLAVPAYNAMVRSIGKEQAVRPETFLQSAISALA